MYNNTGVFIEITRNSSSTIVKKTKKFKQFQYLRSPISSSTSSFLSESKQKSTQQIQQKSQQKNDPKNQKTV